MDHYFEGRTIQQFPHCDSRVLHAPGECQYCDAHPEWQELRESWGINFTGHHKKASDFGTPFLPCPSEAARPLANINRWDGNVPMKGDQINTKSAALQGQQVTGHDPISRVVSFSPTQDEAAEQLKKHANSDLCHALVNLLREILDIL